MALLEANRRIEELTMFKVLIYVVFIKLTVRLEHVDWFISVVLGAVSLS